MRKFQILCMALMLSGTVGCSTQLPTMNGDGLMASGSSRGTHNNGNFGDWDDSGNVTQSNSAAVAVGDDSRVSIKQKNLAVGNAAQQIGDANNISGGKGKTGSGSSSNDDNVGLWEESGNTEQANAAAVAGGDGTRVKIRQKNDAEGATAQQIGNGNNLSSKGPGYSYSRSKQSTSRWGQ